MNKVSVLGAGSWGSALALVLAKNGFDVSMWTLNEEQCNYINKNRENIEYLPGVHIHENIITTTNLKESIKDSKIILLAVPSQAIRSICQKIKPFINDNQILVDVAKGLESNTGLRLSDVCKE